MDMALKNKSYRVDGDVADAFGDYCQARGVLIERTVEALLVYVLSLDMTELGQLLHRAEQWKASPSETEDEKAHRAERLVLEETDRAKRDEEAQKRPRGGRKKGTQGA